MHRGLTASSPNIRLFQRTDLMLVMDRSYLKVWRNRTGRLRMHATIAVAYELKFAFADAAGSHKTRQFIIKEEYTDVGNDHCTFACLMARRVGNE